MAAGRLLGGMLPLLCAASNPAMSTPKAQYLAKHKACQESKHACTAMLLWPPDWEGHYAGNGVRLEYQQHGRP